MPSTTNGRRTHAAYLLGKFKFVKRVEAVTMTLRLGQRSGHAVVSPRHIKGMGRDRTVNEKRNQGG